MKTTTNYKIFKRLKGNRAVDDNAVKALSVSVAQKNLLSQIPIIVNEKMEVIDGQHRLELAKKLKIPIFYIVIDGASYEDVVRLNRFVRPWKFNDYLESYCELGYKNYQVVKDFINKYNLSPHNAVALLMIGEGRDVAFSRVKSAINIFRTGKFEVYSLKTAQEIVEWALDLAPYVEKGVLADREFLLAIARVWHANEISRVEMVEKFQAYPDKLSHKEKVTDYLRQFELIIGFGTRKNVRLF